eukprot:gnl/Trimastix_PCT/3758.p1 GENE.gnl/Trimastix_PCT/3758~~gnl/Trimastix_PCT/3758.p1  ORF type:complete len:925 (+),score=327.47 gnl/Trimastix_PCT/3758:19-2793(+)
MRFAVVLLACVVLTLAEPLYVLENVHHQLWGFSGDIVHRGGHGRYGRDISPLRMEVRMETRSRVHMKIVDARHRRWEVPADDVIVAPPVTHRPREMDYHVDYSTHPFGIVITRSNGEMLFNTTPSAADQGLVFEDRYLHISTALHAETSIYGLGERVDTLRLRNPHTYTVFARDRGGTPENTNLNGAHPFYMELRPDGTAHGVLLLNSNAMDVRLDPGRLSYQVSGGVLDLYLLTGPTPVDVIQQYAELIGRPSLVPHWGLGFHQCRWGYHDLDEVKKVVEEYRKHDLPLDTMWADIDYMDRYLDFTVDPQRFPQAEFKAFVDRLHGDKQHFVPILDPGIKIAADYEAFTDGLERGVYIMNPDRQTPFIGKVWPGLTAWPDFFNSETKRYWAHWLHEFHKKLPYDGLWIDMNEPDSFCSYKCETVTLYYQTGWEATYLRYNPDYTGWMSHDEMFFKHWAKAPQHNDRFVMVSAHHLEFALHDGQGHWDNNQGRNYVIDSPGVYRLADGRLSKLHDSADDLPAPNRDDDHPPFVPGGEALYLKTITMNAVQNTTKHFNAHSLYGWSEGLATVWALKRLLPNKRPFVISRSTFPGSGHHHGHWLGDNYSRWSYLAHSITGVIDMNMFGIPFVGADICGFLEDTTRELCTRWFQVGAFYPFSRDHNHLTAKPQEPYIWGEETTSIMRKALHIRYTLIDHMYTLMMDAHRTGRPVFNALSFVFPRDRATHALEAQFMLGDSLLVTPVLTEGATQVTGYFPDARWFDYFTGEEFHTRGGRATLSAPLDTVPVHLRGGAVLPIHPSPKLTAVETAASPYRLLAALDDQQRAKGTLFMDDGESLDIMQTRRYTEMSYTVHDRHLAVRPLHDRYAQAAVRRVDSVVVYGVQGRVQHVLVNGAVHKHWSLRGTTLTVEGLSFPANSRFDITWA